MKIIAVDDERIALEGLIDLIQEVVPDAELNGFEYPEDALEFVALHECNVAFLDVEMAGMSGVELAERLKQYNPDINIIFATGFDEYRKEAYDMHASGYLTKPITADKVKRELDDLRRPIPKQSRMRVQAFGNFEVYIDNRPVAFKYNKTKELLAYLVDRRGALCTIGELQAVIFEDDDGHEAYMKSLRRDLLETLEAAGCVNVIACQRGKLGVVPERMQCAAKTANAHDVITRLPQGYDTMLTGGESQLSQGQRQLIAIARAAVADPPVMILDEATSSIDTRTEKLVQDGMDALMKGRTVFVIAHRLSTIQNSDCSMVLDHGRIIERGSHDDLIAERGTYYRLYTGAFELE